MAESPRPHDAVLLRTISHLSAPGGHNEMNGVLHNSPNAPAPHRIARIVPKVNSLHRAHSSRSEVFSPEISSGGRSGATISISDDNNRSRVQRIQHLRTQSPESTNRQTKKFLHSIIIALGIGIIVITLVFLFCFGKTILNDNGVMESSSISYPRWFDVSYADNSSWI